MQSVNIKTFSPVILVLICSSFVLCSDGQSKHREKRSMVPKLKMTVTYGNVTSIMNSGSTYYYNAVVEHIDGESSSDAEGTKVLFILAPFVNFKEVTSYTINKPTPVVKDDSVTMKLNTVIWASKVSFQFTVTFNKDMVLLPGKHHVITHAQVVYYTKYAEDGNGMVTNKESFWKLPLQTMKFDVEIPGCTSALGMKTKEIQDFQVGASSSYAEAQPSQAREFDDAWCAYVSNDQQYLQIDFTDTKRITGLTTIRRRSKPMWVTEYYLMYSMDGENWNEYIENGFRKSFEGNTESFDPVTQWLSTPFQAISLRVRPTKWKELICFRLELYGCSVKGSGINCILPLGMESGLISDQALSDKQPLDSVARMTLPQTARLNKKVDAFPNGWVSDPATVYLQVDLGSVHRITRSAIQGGYTDMQETMFYTKTYRLMYSNNSLEWFDYKESGANKILQGPKDGFDAKYPKIVNLHPFSARFVRFYPEEGANGMKVLRGELYGCLHDPEPIYKDLTDLNYFRRSFLVDPTTDQFIICMFTDVSFESSCFATNNSKFWRAIDPKIIAIIAANPRNKEVYALDRLMNLHRTQDSGVSWYQISREYYNLAAGESTLTKAIGIPDNFVAGLPTANTTIDTSTGAKWGVSAEKIHFMSSGGSSWTTVGAWKCCGM